MPTRTRTSGVDNADDPGIFFGTGHSKGIVDYLPESETNIFVYTTRTPEAAEVTRGDVIKSLTSKSLLRNDAAINELLDELTCLPLVIARAAAYLNRNRMLFAKYLHLLRSTEQDTIALMSREFRDDTRYKESANAVATTWVVVSFSQIRERDAVAADLPAFMSCVEWKAIPQSMLPRSAGKSGRWRKPLAHSVDTLFLARRVDSDEYNSRKDSKSEANEIEEWVRQCTDLYIWRLGFGLASTAVRKKGDRRSSTACGRHLPVGRLREPRDVEG
ncbi:hypothetical protein GQ44DRAFT_775985 [Phaeosphaeriaceae sp. PMI808]|nr:hypothetical protein GQ44DRAFT_775985 [Phaeosphaeriaceae sp. PMI808]